ncbi:MAG: hypothetical protein IJO06_07540 [Thermoguttaceae bacterium]|nr:hypothetical protein [Thermoguttaceae bacterium]
MGACGVLSGILGSLRRFERNFWELAAFELAFGRSWGVPSRRLAIHRRFWGAGRRDA